MSRETTSTADLTPAERTAYQLLMGHFRLNLRPTSTEDLYRVCRCASDADRQVVNSVLDEFFKRVEETPPSPALRGPNAQENH